MRGCMDAYLWHVLSAPSTSSVIEISCRSKASACDTSAMALTQQRHERTVWNSRSPRRVASHEGISTPPPRTPFEPVPLGADSPVVPGQELRKAKRCEVLGLFLTVLP